MMQVYLKWIFLTFCSIVSYLWWFVTLVLYSSEFYISSSCFFLLRVFNIAFQQFLFKLQENCRCRKICRIKKDIYLLLDNAVEGHRLFLYPVSWRKFVIYPYCANELRIYQNMWSTYVICFSSKRSRLV